MIHVSKMLSATVLGPGSAGVAIILAHVLIQASQSRVRNRAVGGTPNDMLTKNLNLCTCTDTLLSL